MPTQLLGPDNLPIYSGTTEADRFDVGVVKYQGIVLDHHLPVMTVALRRLGENHGIPDEASLMGFLRTWPGLDRTSARMAANALLRFWSGDFDGSVYTLLPQIERTARNLLLAAGEGIYRQLREVTRGQYMGLGALLKPLGRLDHVVAAGHNAGQIMSGLDQKRDLVRAHAQQSETPSTQ
jgi:hypothetical protein